jgi:hypothetical protein
MGGYKWLKQQHASITMITREIDLQINKTNKTHLTIIQ